MRRAREPLNPEAKGPCPPPALHDLWTLQTQQRHWGSLCHGALTPGPGKSGPLFLTHVVLSGGQGAGLTVHSVTAEEQGRA